MAVKDGPSPSLLVREKREGGFVHHAVKLSQGTLLRSPRRFGSSSSRSIKDSLLLPEFEQEIRSTLEDVKASDHPFSGQDVNASALGSTMSAVSTRAFHLHGDKSFKVDLLMMFP
ncbi:hypothetical protein EUTSA_v10017450mg [Eutrema salsugineum]|uniref:Uncharacterized protein n=1 Tax=Eutrema salsugineum TaxID=72664 RepID=V4LL22_EUTSA|nr:hypothetical protein EUTSA_v10017450mg [Eutrema salsugineum]